MSEEKRICVSKDGKLYREGQEHETICTTCEKKSEPCISFLAHENAMLHKDSDNERAHRTILYICITFLLIVIIFVTAYTVRTNIWLGTIRDMNAVIVELANAKGITP